ncbi:MAG: hypothetical protein ACJAVK_003408 [Akkermansiaceae bacterium]|jgi:hypothetical protein
MVYPDDIWSRRLRETSKRGTSLTRRNRLSTVATTLLVSPLVSLIPLLVVVVMIGGMSPVLPALAPVLTNRVSNHTESDSPDSRAGRIDCLTAIAIRVETCGATYSHCPQKNHRT